MKNENCKMKQNVILSEAKNLIISLLILFLFPPVFVFSQNTFVSDPTIMMLQSEITKQDVADELARQNKLIKCTRCDTEVLESSKYCSNCGKLLKKNVADELARQSMGDDIRGYVGPKLGVFVPMNSDMRDVYSDGLIYGVNLQIWWREIGSILES